MLPDGVGSALPTNMLVALSENTNTTKTTKWAARIYSKWAKAHNIAAPNDSDCIPENIEELPSEKANFVLSRFIVEVVDNKGNYKHS